MAEAASAPPAPTARRPPKRWSSWWAPTSPARYPASTSTWPTTRATSWWGEVDGCEIGLDARVRRGRRAHLHRLSSSRTSSPATAVGPRGSARGWAARRPSSRRTSPAPHRRPPGHVARDRGGEPRPDFVRAAVALCPAPPLSLDVALNRARRQLAGGLRRARCPTAHRAACAFVERTAVRPVAGPFEVVVTTGGGHPLDRNLYQAVKGMAAANGGDRGRHDPDPGRGLRRTGFPPLGAFARLLARGAHRGGRAGLP